MHCPIAKPTVSAAIAPVHIRAVTALRTNAVTEVGTIKNEPPKTTAEADTPAARRDPAAEPEAPLPA